MDNKTQHGYLVLADISGYTAYLAQVELDHAHEILSDLLAVIVASLTGLFTLAKLEGDAVFAYAAEARVPRGETLLDLLETAYTRFCDRRAAAQRRTTCTCRACRALPELDLKFILHHGDYIVQNVAGIRELVGSDVNLAHRLLKNHVAEATGWRAYLLFTERVREHLGLELDDLQRLTETYEHLGSVATLSYDLRPRYQALVEARRVAVTDADAYVVTDQSCAAPPAIVWEWLNDPAKRPEYAFEAGLVFQAVARPGGRTGVGAQTHCLHGRKLAMVETVLDWRPFEYFTVRQSFSPVECLATFYLTPTPDGGTHLHVCERGRVTGSTALDRLILRFLFTRIYPSAQLLRNLAQRLQAVAAPAA